MFFSLWNKTLTSYSLRSADWSAVCESRGGLNISLSSLLVTIKKDQMFVWCFWSLNTCDCTQMFQQHVWKQKLRSLSCLDYLQCVVCYCWQTECLQVSSASCPLWSDRPLSFWSLCVDGWAKCSGCSENICFCCSHQHPENSSESASLRHEHHHAGKWETFVQWTNELFYPNQEKTKLIPSPQLILRSKQIISFENVDFNSC